MKTLFSLLFTLLLLSSQAQITTGRINDVRLNKTLEEIEQTIGQKLKLKSDEYDWLSYAEISHKGIQMKLGFVKRTNEEGTSENFILYEIRTSSHNIKTLSGIGVGSNLDDLWNTYKKDFNLSVWFLYDDEIQDISKKKRMFELTGLEEYTVIRFYLDNDKITEIVISISEDGC
ncbi:MAG: hypothetical protein WCY16_08830 [Weeksellaceae bacterium]